MDIKTFLLVCCSALLASATNAQNTTKKPTATEAETAAHISLMDKRASELMADRVDFNKEIALKELAQLEEELIMEEEDMLFPADELYGSNWDTRWVNPFQGGKVEFPDSCQIDCSSFVYPIAIDSIARVTSNYGPRRRRMHKGIDLKVLVGDTIRAAFDGKIRITNYERRGYGQYVVVRHPNGLETIYGHLSKTFVKVNDIVRAGEPIALGGNTGRSTGSHLHFETRFLGQAINPAEIIDFVNGVPHQDTYVFRNLKINGRNSNIYTSSTQQLMYHRIKSGDTLGAIAKRYGTSVGELCRLNGLKPTSTLRLGQSIRCGTATTGTATAGTDKKATTPKKAAPAAKPNTVQVDAAAVASLNQGTTDGTAPKSSIIYHRIKQGDTLGELASKYGTTVSKLCQLNGITKTTTLALGRAIRCS